MKPSARKAVPGKTMRVATTFTGAVACAAAFAPTAMAGTAHVMQPARGLLPDTTASINATRCTPGTSHYFHLGDEDAASCFYGSGTFDVNHEPATSFCGGNNIGWLDGVLGSPNFGKPYRTTFHQGTFYAHIPGTTAVSPLFVSFVHISKWSGHDTCTNNP
jgi:hypothetical protein